MRHGFHTIVRLLKHEPEFRDELAKLNEKIECDKLLKGRRKQYHMALPESHDLQVLVRTEKKSFDLANVVEIRRGIASQETMAQEGELDPDRCVTLFYVSSDRLSTKELNLVFASKEAADFYHKKLIEIVSKLQGHDGELFVLSRHFNEFSVDGKVSARQAVKLLERLNVSVTTRASKKLIEEFDANGDRKMDFAEFCNLIRSLRRYAVVSEHFKAAAEGQSVLSPAQLNRWLEQQGREWRYEDSEPLNELQFQHFVVSRLKPVVVQALDDALLLPHYLVNSSHNTYLSTTDQLAGKSSVEMFAVSAKLGVRCVELDVWDGDANGPIVYHGYTLVTKLYLRDVLRIIRRHAFESSEYPLILSVENHCSMEQQDVMADQLEEVLGAENIYVRAAMPRLKDVKRKYLVKAKMLKHEGDRNVAVVSDRLRRLISLPIGEWTDEADAAAWSDVTMANLSETKAASLDEAFLRNFSDHHLTRVYPKGTRVDSSNFNPLPFMKKGAQVCAINLQHFGPENFANFGFFSQTGSAGYVVKPGGSAQPLSLTVTVHGARNIPLSQRDILDPYASVYVVSAAGTSQRVKSGVVLNNGLNPDFGNLECTFEIDDARFAVLVIEIIDADPGLDDLICFFSAPVNALAEGLSAAPLLNRRLYQVNKGIANVLLSVKKLKKFKKTKK